MCEKRINKEEKKRMKNEKKKIMKKKQFEARINKDNEF